jgi:Ca-activated chloride channel family protein
MKRLLTPLFALLLLTACGGAKTEKIIESGNQAFADQAYETALEAYAQAATTEPELAEPLYNAANVHYRQGAFDQAGATMAVALTRADEALGANAQFNLGNSRFQTEQYAEAAAAYKDALRLNPDDLEAKVNLELTLQMLQQQEQQEQEQQQENENQEQQDQGSEGDQSEESEQQEQDGESGEEEQEQSDPNKDEQQSPAQAGDEQNQDNQSDEQQQEQGDQSQGEQQSPEQQDEQQEDSQSGQSDEERREDGQGESADPQQPDEGEPQDVQGDAGQEAEPQAESEAGQGGAGQPGDETDQSPTATGAMGGDVEGLTEEQARQLLIAAGQGTQTLQETLQQMYAFPYADVEQDW